jgi:hypothetical protein
LNRVTCPICDAACGGGDAIGESTVFVCPQCGGYRLAGTVITLFENHSLARPDSLSFRDLVKRKRGTSPDYPMITSANIDRALFDTLAQFVNEDPRLEHIDITLQPAQFRFLIGGQTPFWEFAVDVERLRKGDFREYALAIIDRWHDQRR